MNDSADSVASFLYAVAAPLPGPRRHRAAILAELRDGLLEAAESNQRAGLEPAEAIGRALREFGDAESLAASFRPELMIVRGRRTALALLGAAPIVTALWIGAARSRGQTKGISHLFDSPLDHLAAAMMIGAVIASGIWIVATTGRASRWRPVQPRAALFGAAAMGLITITIDLAAVSIIGVRLAGYPGTLHALLLAAAIGASCASLLFATRTSWSCVAMIKDPA